MKIPFDRRVSISWLLLVVIATGAAVILWKVMVMDAPPSGALFITEGSSADGPSATRTPFGGIAAAETAQPVTDERHGTPAAAPPGEVALIISPTLPAVLPSGTLSLKGTLLKGALLPHPNQLRQLP